MVMAKSSEKAEYIVPMVPATCKLISNALREPINYIMVTKFSCIFLPIYYSMRGQSIKIYCHFLKTKLQAKELLHLLVLMIGYIMRGPMIEYIYKKLRFYNIFELVN